MPAPVYFADLTGWVREAIGTAIDEPLPKGYHITGSADRKRTRVSLILFAPRYQLEERNDVAWASAEATYRRMVERAWRDSREYAEPGLTVTTNADGFITSIEEDVA